MTYKVWKDEPFEWAPQRKLGTKGWIAFKDPPAAPPPPDYAAAAKETANGNLEAARLNVQANRVDQVNPWATKTYTQPDKKFDEARYNEALAKYQGLEDALNANPDGAQMRQYMDAIGQPNKKPSVDDYTTGQDKWVENIELDPRLQASLDSQLNVQTGRSQLAEGMLGQLADKYKTPFAAPDMEKFLASVQAIDQSAVNTKDYTAQIEKLKSDFPEVAQYLNGVGAVNQNAPQYDPSQAKQYQQAAYDAQMEFLNPAMAKEEERNQNRLKLQGITGGSEADYNAMKALYDSQGQQRNQVSNQSMLTGAQIAQGNYQQQLAGYGAGLASQAQAFGQGLSKQQADLSARQVNNSALQNNYGNALQEAGLQQTNNNAANVARNQAYEQAMARYQAEYASKYAERTLPLNELNSLLTGQQVAQPQFSSYNTQGQTMGADYMGALGAQTKYDQGLYNAQAAATGASNAATGQAVGSIAGAAAAFFF